MRPFSKTGLDIVDTFDELFYDWQNWISYKFGLFSQFVPVEILELAVLDN